MIAKRRPVLWILLCGGFISVGSMQASATPVSGNIANQTWTAIDNPYELTGDVIVTSGASLNVESNSIIIAAPFDSAAAGVSPAEVEFIVNGTLNLNSTQGSSISFEPRSGFSNSSWYGLRANAGSEVNVTGLTTVSGDARFLGGSSLNISLGNPETNVSVDGNVFLGSSLQVTKNPEILAIGDTRTIVDISGSNTAIGTFAGLGEGASLTSDAVTWDISYAGGSGNEVTLSVADIDISTTLGGGGTGSGGGGGPCTSGPGTSISGNLGSIVFSCGQNPILLTGDTYVAPGTTLTIQSGVTVGASDIDDLATGLDIAEVELTIDGSLSLESVNGAPVVIGPAASTGIDGWTGLVVGDGGEIGLGATTIIEGDLRLEGGSTFFSSVHDTNTYGNIQLGGDLYLDGALSLFFGESYRPAAGDLLTLFELSLGEFVFGGFDGLAEGALIELANYDFQITYLGGDGNDVTLSVLRSSVSPIPLPPGFLLMATSLAGILIFFRQSAKTLNRTTTLNAHLPVINRFWALAQTSIANRDESKRFRSTTHWRQCS